MAPEEWQLRQWNNDGMESYWKPPEPKPESKREPNDLEIACAYIGELERQRALLIAALEGVTYRYATRFGELFGETELSPLLRQPDVIQTAMNALNEVMGVRTDADQV